MGFKKATPKQAVVADIKATEVLKVAATITPESVAKKLADAAQATQKAIASATATVFERFAELDTIDAKIALKESELKKLHGIEVATVELEELEAKIELFRAAMVEETLNAETERARELEQYEYNRDHDRTVERDRYDRAKFAERAQLTKDQAEIASKVEELAALKAAAAEHDAAVVKAEGAGFAKGLNSAKRDAEQAAALVAAQHAADKRIWDNAQQHVSGELGRAGQRIAALEAQLEKAHAENVTLAQTAVNAASHQKVAESLRTTVDAQTAAAATPARR